MFCGLLTEKVFYSLFTTMAEGLNGSLCPPPALAYSRIATDIDQDNLSYFNHNFNQERKFKHLFKVETHEEKLKTPFQVRNLSLRLQQYDSRPYCHQRWILTNYVTQLHSPK